MTIYIGFELHNELSKLIEKAENERKIFLKKVEELKFDENTNTYLRDETEIEQKIKERTKPFFDKFSNEIELINTQIAEEIKKYQEKWQPTEFYRMNIEQLKEIFNFLQFDIPDELLEEIIMEILGTERENLKTLTAIKQALIGKKMVKLFKPLKNRNTLLKLLNGEMKEIKKHKIEIQTEENYNKKYQDFLNEIEKLQNKIFELKHR